MQEKIDEIIKFWFEDVTPEKKFQKDEVFDTEIKDRFESTYWEIINGETESWRKTPKGRLAEIIVLDQFARNMFRGHKQSWLGDQLALGLAKGALAISADKEVSEEQRMFFYMPYMHSESKEVHEEAVKIFTEYGNELNLKYELMHKEIIDRFGRYPYQNELLGRESTPEEIEWLKENESF